MNHPVFNPQNDLQKKTELNFIEKIIIMMFVSDLNKK